MRLTITRSCRGRSFITTPVDGSVMQTKRQNDY